MYDEGEDVPQDHAEAVRWYRRAAEQGYAGAQFNLGTIATRAFLDAEGIPYETAPVEVAAVARKFTVLVECWK